MPARALSTLAAVALLALSSAVPAVADETDVPGTAGADTLTGVAEPARPAFYEPPTEIPATPGTVIRTEFADTVSDPLRVNDAHFDARRIMYSTQDREGRAIAATGIVVVPRSAWLGPGRQRPIIVHAPGTQGTGDRCAASRQFQAFTQYEILFMKDLLLRGYAVAVPDYQGLGTPGSHTYMVREAQAHAVLDMARATARVGFPGITPENPVGLNGYSQGGGASAAAGELAPSYAPEIPIKGIAAGAPPADLETVGVNIDGGPYTAFALYTAIGLFTGHHVDPDSVFDETGLETLRRAEDNCTQDRAEFSGLDTSTLTDAGVKVSALFDEEPMASILAENRIGRLEPAAPVLITHALGDDVIPYRVGEQLAKDWCAQGADVQFRTHLDSSHALGAIPHSMAAQLWFEGRFSGIPQVSNCRSL